MSVRPELRAELVGHVVGLMAESDVHCRWTVIDIVRLVVAPVCLGQSFTFAVDRVPCGWVSWANLTEEAEAGYLSRTRRLKPEDWNAGDGSRIWIVDALAPRGGILRMARVIKTELRTIADRRGWPATEARWARGYGTGSVLHIGSVHG